MAFVMNGHKCIVFRTLFSFFTPVYTGFFSGRPWPVSGLKEETGMLEHDIKGQ